MKKLKLLSLSCVLALSSSVWAATGVQVPGATGANGHGGQAAGAAPAWVNLVLIGGIVLLMWLFVIRPQSKRAKEQKVFLESLKTGMEVITTGGMIGTIVEVKDTTVTLNLGETTVKILKSSVSGKMEANLQEVK